MHINHLARPLIMLAAIPCFGRGAAGDDAVPFGKTSTVRDHYREITVSLSETAAVSRKLDIVIRACDDGIAFQYRLPDQAELDDFVIANESTSFKFAGDPMARLLPLNHFQTPYEELYQTRRLSADFRRPRSATGPAQRPSSGHAAAWRSILRAIVIGNRAGTTQA